MAAIQQEEELPELELELGVFEVSDMFSHYCGYFEFFTYRYIFSYQIQGSIFWFPPFKRRMHQIFDLIYITFIHLEYSV